MTTQTAEDDGSYAMVRYARSRHQPSKSGPIPVDHTLASRWSGVEQPGPSRQPNRSNNEHTDPSILPSIHERALSTLPQKPNDTCAQRFPYSGNGNPNPKCKNLNKRYRYETYEPCECPPCRKKSRSIYVKGLSKTSLETTTEVVEILSAHFKAWGHVEACYVKCGNEKALTALVQ